MQSADLEDVARCMCIQFSPDLPEVVKWFGVDVASSIKNGTNWERDASDLDLVQWERTTDTGLKRM